MRTDKGSQESRRPVRSLVHLLAAAIAAGLLLGVASRMAMRAVAIDAGLDAGFSIGGSLEVVASGVLIGSPLALVLGVAARRWRLPRGSALGASSILFLVLAMGPPPAARSAISTVPGSVGPALAMFACAFFLYGLGLELLVGRCRNRTRPRRAWAGRGPTNPTRPR
ncbi:hypothetical protein [Halomonas denitrificans]|nr:hypothetical protein [Halomonas denitrificans]